MVKSPIWDMRGNQRKLEVTESDNLLCEMRLVYDIESFHVRDRTILCACGS